MSLRIVIDARHLRDFGIGTYIRNLVRAMGALDQENRYVLVAQSEDREDLAGLPQNFEIVAYQRRDSDLLDQVSFPLFLRNLAADVYHVPHGLAPLLMPRPYVITIHDISNLIFEQGAGVRQASRLFQFRRGLMRAEKVIAVSAATRRDVENLFGVPSSRLRQIYNAPDPRFAVGSPSGDSDNGSETRPAGADRTLDRYQIHYPFLLYAGSIRPQKNIPRLVEAFAVVRRRLENHPVYKDLHLIIIGDEISKYPAVRRTVIQTRMEAFVRFLGFVPIDTLRIFYQAASAFVFPSLYEGFGLPPLEAMTCGTPVVTSNVSSLPEVVGDAAVLVNPEIVFDVAKGLHEVLCNENLRLELIRKGFEQAQRFSWEFTAGEVLGIYREAARA